jgi:hypothetical protein
MVASAYFQGYNEFENTPLDKCCLGALRFERHLKQVALKRGVVVIDVNESYTSKPAPNADIIT